jgi:hypothetical protein
MTISVIKTALFSSLASWFFFAISPIDLLMFQNNICRYWTCCILFYGQVMSTLLPFARQFLHSFIYRLNDNEGLPHKTFSRYCPFHCHPTEGSDPFSSFYLFFVLFSLSLFFSFLSLPSTFLLTLSSKQDRALLLSER